MNHVATQLTAAVVQFLATINRGIDWEHRPSAAKWSKKEILGHLCDSAQINLQRFVRCTYEENFKLVYEQNEWVAAQRYQDLPIDALVPLWRLLNLQVSRVLENYPPDRLQARCDTDKNDVNLRSVEWLAQDYLSHLKHHLSQIGL